MPEKKVFCKKCNRPLKFVKTKNNKWMPIEPDSYSSDDGAVYLPNIHVSHFDVCPARPKDQPTRHIYHHPNDR